MKVLVTGAAGFLGCGLVAALEGRHQLRLMDVVDFQTPHEKVVGDVADLDAVRRAVDGLDAIVIAHMAPTQTKSYATPGQPFDVNVKGTANLFFAGVERGLKRYVLISSGAVVAGHQAPWYARDLPLKAANLYGLTKLCQETIARHFQRLHRLQVAALRCGYILSADDPNRVVDKYGRRVETRNGPDIERRDIGEAARLALELPDLTYETFYILGAPETASSYDMRPSYERLGWRPKYDFTWLPLGPNAGRREPAADSLAVAADRPDGIYEVGQEVAFVITLSGGGRPTTKGQVVCEITADDGAVIAAETLAVTGGPLTVRGKLDRPGVLRCQATFEAAPDATLTASGGAAVAPLSIAASLPAPDDFDAFWARQKARLAAVKPTARMTPVAGPFLGVDFFDVEVACLGDRPVSGYLARPAHARPRSLPALLCTHSAGILGSDIERAGLGALSGFLAFDINAHGLPNCRSDAWYADLAAREFGTYSRRGIESPETFFFLGMYLRLVRAIDFLAAQGEWNGRVLVAAGVSQGGGQALVAAGLDPRVTILSACVPTFCDRTAALVGRQPGWPGALPTGPDGRPDPRAVATVRYYDAVNFAARARAEALFATGFLDGLCPASGVYAACNAYAGPKRMIACPNGDHALGSLGPAVRKQMRDWYVARAHAAAEK